MYLHTAVIRRKLAADSGKKVRFMLAQWPKFTWQRVLLRWADYIAGTNSPQEKQRELARNGLLPVSFSCCQIKRVVAATVIGSLSLDGKSGIAIQPAKGKL